MADMSREEVPARYRHLRAIGTRHHTEALRFLSRPALLEQARQLGLTAGGMLVAESMDEFTLVVDLAIHATRPGRSRAIDRYAGAAQLQPGSDEALVLEAMRRARFSLWRVERRHEVVGLVVQDLLREGEAWLVDEAMERSAPAGMVAAMRLCTPETFAMTCGVIVPVDRELLEEVIATVRLAGPGRRRSPVRDRDLPHGGGEGADGTGRLRGGTAPGPLTASMRSSSRPKMAKVELSGRLVTVPLDDPGLVVGLLEGLERQAQLLDGLEATHPQQVLLQGPDEPLGPPVPLRGPEDRLRRCLQARARRPASSRCRGRGSRPGSGG